MSVDHLKLSSLSGFDADATVTDDGRVDISFAENNPGRLAALLAAAQVALPGGGAETPSPGPSPGPSVPGPPRLHIVIQVVGSRGDVQPFVALGRVLSRDYGHRVRLVTHSVFRTFVEGEGGSDDSPAGSLEFCDIGGGDPAELMAFMVENAKGAKKKSGGDGADDNDNSGGGGGGLIPPMEAYTSGAIGRRRRFIEAVLQGCWRSMGDDADDEGAAAGRPPFVADALIANPPSFAHVHIAERLGIPLHLMFTMPWTPTRAFPHPLANLTLTAPEEGAGETAAPAAALYGFACYLSYTLVECLTWQGLGDLINRFRRRDLGLLPLSPLLAVAPFQQGGLMGRLRVPTTYCWSPALLPKPADWGPEITVAGPFYAAEKDADADAAAAPYTPGAELAAFLRAGPQPLVYVGFGSIVVDDSAELTRTVLEALRQLGSGGGAGVRAIVAQGWSTLGAGADTAVDLAADGAVFFLDQDCPHEWLFPQMACVVHHGGAGTTAAGLRYGVPTVVVPFFGDQSFWGSLVARAGAGPRPVPFPQLTAGRLAAAIETALLPATRDQAQAIGAKMRGDTGTTTTTTEAGGSGTATGARAFHRHLDVSRMRCALLPERVAVWQTIGRDGGRARKGKPAANEAEATWPAVPGGVRLSALAAAMLVEAEELSWSDVELFRAQEYLLHTDDQPWEPISAAGAAIVGDLSSLAMAVADFPRELFQKRAETTATEGAAAAAPTRVQFDAQAATVTLDTAVQAGRSMGRIVSTGLRSPLHFCTGLARGFHNAPRLYADTTVRPLPPAGAVTSLPGGVVAAGRAFGLGLYDGISGLVTQPLRGAEQNGPGSGGSVTGLLKGFAKGIGGVVLKPAAGAWAIPAYTMQGLQAEVDRLLRGGDEGDGSGGGSSESRMPGRAKLARRAAARRRQGQQELERDRAVAAVRRVAVVADWREMKQGGDGREVKERTP